MNNNLIDPKDSYAEQFVKLVRAELNDIKHTFFKIGFRLAEANREGYYYELGYENIVECAEDLFGFKKTTTYDLINVYNDFHDRLNPMHIKEEYDKYSQTQLVQLTGNIWARDSFAAYVRPEDTIDTIKKAKKLWNKIYNSGKTPGWEGVKRIEFKTLQDFIDIYWDRYYLPALPAPSSSADNFSVQTEKFIEVTAVDAEPQGEDPDDPTEDFSVQTEKLREFAAKALEDYIRRMGYKTNFEPDDNKCGVRVLPDTMSKSMLIGLSKAISRERTKIKHIITNHIIDVLGTFEYEITLYGRKQNFNVFAGMLAGIITDYLIKEFNPNEQSN